MHCRLLIPGLPLGNRESLADFARRRLPGLELLLARGRRTRVAIESREQWLLETFAVQKQQDWPSAPFALLGEGGAPGDAYWMHADPVYFSAGRDHVQVADAGPFVQLTADEAAQLAQDLSAHFGEALHLEVPHPQRWYARIASPPPGSTLALAQAAGRPMQTEAGSIQWHALMSEIQMVLHEHPVNVSREARGEPLFNGLWLWGGGRLSPARASGLREMLTANPLAAGLARAAGVPCSALPEDTLRWLARSSNNGVHFAVLDEPDANASGLLEGVERRWTAPLSSALRAGRIGMVTLHLQSRDAMIQAETTGLDLRRVWRLRRTLDRYLAP
ncbi:MAG: hypothetical protein A3I01_04195 [Betaproteobacteria bacterium RIFCSPLOWO2_02_FULL_65_24]|nr:MAG: hypothetical protein A3I01_04195 [Betaproteobacteria bacterium RIFCSPLOWO2_02_FULL_65_24]OGA71908.1 MAG: hypothetical protein A3G27_17640 [Betaproteobacteria bacterium RIFCSPLOWO2_12_FULL_66_14]